MVPRADANQLTSNAGTIREEACGLEYRTKLTAYAANPADHAELAHVGLYSLDVVVIEELLDLVHCPARGKPWMFMKEESSVFPLMLANLNTTSDVSLGLLHAELELLHPDLVVAIHVFVEFL